MSASLNALHPIENVSQCKNELINVEDFTVKAQLISAESAGDIFENILLKLKAASGDIDYYKGNGQLVNSFWGDSKRDYDTTLEVEFSATFEREKIKNEFATFAKRPSKIGVCKNAE